MDQLPRLGKRELIFLLLFTCNYVFSVWRGFLFLWVLGVSYVILLWHSLSLPYNHFDMLLHNGRGSCFGCQYSTRLLGLDKNEGVSNLVDTSREAMVSNIDKKKLALHIEYITCNVFTLEFVNTIHV